MVVVTKKNRYTYFTLELTNNYSCWLNCLALRLNTNQLYRFTYCTDFPQQQTETEFVQILTVENKTKPMSYKASTDIRMQLYRQTFSLTRNVLRYVNAPEFYLINIHYNSPESVFLRCFCFKDTKRE
jgi:hypothetical protein